MIKLTNIYKSFGNHTVLNDLNLEIEQGEHVLLTGVSGSGKSTVLRLITGLEIPDSGTIELKQQTVTDGSKFYIEPKDRGIGFVPQDLGLWDNLSVQKNILLGRKVDASVLNTLLDTSGLTGQQHRAVATLSAGERQRVALVRALVMKPGILLLDEPFASLDLLKRKDFHQAVRNLVSDECTVITVTHDLTDWHGLEPDRLLVLESGDIIDDHMRGEGQGIYNSRLLNSWQKVGFNL